MLFSYLVVPISNVVLNFPIEKTGVMIFSKDIDYGREGFKRLKILEKDQEVANYPKFMIYILDNLLEYDITAFKHEEKNMEFPFKNKSEEFLVCFEAKGTKTKDLWAPQGRDTKIRETPVDQINDYMYKNKIPYGVLTNYKIFVLFRREEGYTKFHKFDFLDIKENAEKLKEFIAIFSRESFEENKPEKIYKESIIEERNFTKEFYKLFHETRLMILREFNEKEIDEKFSLHFTQLFLNRLMFIFFAEDAGFLDKKYFETKILEVLKSSDIIDNHTDYIFGKIKSIFIELDSEIPKQIRGFNGELFKERIDGRLSFKDYRNKSFFKNILQNYKLDKNLDLYENEKKIFNYHKNKISKIIYNILLMASFDFNTEVSVNILGHIFEQSISDLEELKEEKILRRKKEGVYYTPDFITDYICRNTIIPYLSKKGVNTVDKLIDEYNDDIEVLEQKFNNLKVLDPACGSGSFLIKAVEVLLEIHKQIQIVKQIQGQYTAKKVAGLSRKQKRAFRDDLQLSFTKWYEVDEAREIIEKNIFGVDINEESVEITKLSLFLKIVKKDKKLMDLSKNIKCGNSLIDDPEFACEKEFNWEKEFPFKFDIIIGNPPYVSNWQLSDSNRSQVLHLSDKYSDVAFGHWDLYVMFIYKALLMMEKGGYHSFILPSSFSMEKYGKSLREIIVNKHMIKSLVDFGVETVFDEVARQYVVYTIKNGHKPKNNIRIYKFNKEILNFKYSHKINQDSFLEFHNYTFRTDLDNNDINLKQKIEKNCEKIGNICCINEGVVSHSKKDSPITFKKDDVIHNRYGKGYKLYIEGENISRYLINWKNLYMDYESKSNYFHRPKFRQLFENPKIMIRRVSGENNSIIGVYDEGKYYTNDNVIHMIVWNDIILNYQKPKKPWKVSPNSEDYSLKIILAILNSKLMTYYFSKFISTGTLQGTYSGIYPEDLRSFPIKKKFESFKSILEKSVEKIIKLKSELNSKKTILTNRIKGEFNIEKIPKKINDFYKLTNIEFLKEIEKLSSINLSFDDKDNWEVYFNKHKKNLISLKEQISIINDNIDQEVYKLYGLNKKEISIIEENS